MLDPTRAGIPWRRTASRNSGQRSSGIVEQKSLARSLDHDDDDDDADDDDDGCDVCGNVLYC